MHLTARIYTDETAARKHLEKLLWPNGPVCPHCGVLEEATKLKGASTRPGVYWCNACQKPFSVTVGTVYERSHIPLHKWLLATHLLTSSKKGMSAHQLMRMLGLGSYRSAWFMAHRIREGMTPKAEEKGPLGGEGKIIEADETYLLKSGNKLTPKSGGYAHKMKVLSLTERGGRVRSMRIIDGTKLEVGALVRKNIDPLSILHTDGSGLYVGIGASKEHETVDHNKGYVGIGRKKRKVHTNSLEGFFSVFKRGMVGTYQHCGEQHLNRYLAEFDFRQNNRIALGIDDDMRSATALKGIIGKRLTYRRTRKAAHH